MQDSLCEKKLLCNVITNIIAVNDKLKKDDTIYPKLSFDIQSSFQIAKKAIDEFDKEPAILQINAKSRKSDFIIVGDLHGNLDSLIRIFKEKGYPPKARYLFLGDYVDRGRYSCEVIILLYALKCLFPKEVYMIRGNHEFEDMTDIYGFKDECTNRIENISTDDKEDTASTFYKLITGSFAKLPICAILNDNIFCVHGGITSLIKTRQDLFKIKKVGDTLEKDDLPQEEMMWNDPDKQIYSYKLGTRGRGMIFGDEAVKFFLRSMNFKLIIRAHQDNIKGFDWPFGQKGGLLTVFSSIDYLKTRNNGGIAIVSKNNGDGDLVEIQQFTKYAKFDAVNHVFTYPLHKRAIR